MRLFCLIVLGIQFGCYTPQKENEIKTDIFNLQTRLLKLEQSAKEVEGDSKETKKSSTQRLGAVQSDIERVRIELQKMQGEIDTLKVGVETGEIPGSNSEEMSVSQRISGLQSRIETIEATQIEILDLLENKASGKNESKQETRKIESISDMRQAFNQRRYRHVADVAEELIPKFTAASSKEEGLYLYAESLYKLGKLRDAALKFNDYIEAHPSSNKVAHAKLRMGDSFRHLGDTETARIYYDELVTKYSKSKEAETAKERLQSFDKRGSAKPASSSRRKG